MKAFLYAIVLALAPSTLTAATISYEHSFTLESHEVFPGFPGSEGIRDRHYFNLLSDSWNVPAFDPALGTPEVLFLDLNATGSVTWTIDPPETPVEAYLFFRNPVSGSLEGGGGYSTHIHPVGSQPFHWVIMTHADSHAMYDVSASATFDILITGKAVATYLYEPTATAIPEPATVLLLGSGLISAEWKRRRGHR